MAVFIGFESNKKEFICNKPGGKYATSVECGPPTTPYPTSPPTVSVDVCDSTVNDGDLNIAFMIDDSAASFQEDVVESFIERLITYDVNDLSLMSLIRFESENWMVYRQTSDFTADKDYVIKRLPYAGKYETSGTDAMDDALKSVVDVINTVNDPCNGGLCQLNLVIAFISGKKMSDLDCDLATIDTFADDYPQNIGIIAVVIGGDITDVETEYPCLSHLVSKRYDVWGSSNLFHVPEYSVASLVDVVEGYIRDKVCRGSIAAAYSINGGFIDEEVILNVSSGAYRLFGVIGVLLLLNLVCMVIFVKRSKSMNRFNVKYEAVDVESS